MGVEHEAELLERARRFYIDGHWVAPSGSRTLALIDPPLSS